jgi:hypothetical protein
MATKLWDALSKSLDAQSFNWQTKASTLTNICGILMLTTWKLSLGPLYMLLDAMLMVWCCQFSCLEGPGVSPCSLEDSYLTPCCLVAVSVCDTVNAISAEGPLLGGLADLF